MVSSELDRMDKAWVVRRLPKAVKSLLIKHGPKCCIAGGFIRACIANEQANDIDLFATSKDQAKLMADELAEGRRVIETDNAFTVMGQRFPVQFIHRWTFERPELVVPSFDFTIARAAVWCEMKPSERDSNELKPRWFTLCDQRFYTDLAARRLVYCSPERNEDAGGSMLRVLKFYQRGYRIPLDSMGATMARLVMAIKWDQIDASHRERESQIAKVLTGMLREVDPSIDPDHESHLSAMTSDEPESEPTP